MKKAGSYIPGLGTEFLINSSHVNNKGGAEKYIPHLGKDFKVDNTTEVGAKGGAEKYIPGLGKEFFIHPDHVQQ